MIFDPNTGLITGKLPNDFKELNISIKAMANDGTTRVLNIKIDEKSLSENNNAPENINQNLQNLDKDLSYQTFQDQLKNEHASMKTYGSYIHSLFSNGNSDAIVV